MHDRFSVYRTLKFRVVHLLTETFKQYYPDIGIDVCIPWLTCFCKVSGKKRTFKIREILCDFDDQYN